MTTTEATSGFSSPNTERHDALATASLICGIASWVPLSPPLVTPVAAIALGMASRRRAENARSEKRTSRAATGIMLGSLSLAVLVIICIVYFGVLGYPFPVIHRYHPDH
jgi:hypothetical protein